MLIPFAVGCMIASAALPAAAGAAPPPTPAGAVFVDTDGLAGNTIVAYARATDGALTEAGSYATEGLGGQLSGSVVDHTASQGALVLDRPANLLLAVNAGSDTISAFSVRGDELSLRQVVASEGAFPVSVAVHGNQVYVLNGGEGGSIQGFALFDGHLAAVPSEHRDLHLETLAPGEAEEFTHTPGQIAFTPDGQVLLIATKAGGQSIEGFRAAPLAQQPVVNHEPGTVPFALAFAPGEDVLVADAGTDAVSDFRWLSSGALIKLSEVPTGQKATCWITAAGEFFYASNAGSASVSAIAARPHGSLALLGQTSTHPGTVDSASVGELLYVEGGGEGTIDEFRIASGGALQSIGAVSVARGAAAGADGIAAF